MTLAAVALLAGVMGVSIGACGGGWLVYRAGREHRAGVTEAIKDLGARFDAERAATEAYHGATVELRDSVVRATTDAVKECGAAREACSLAAAVAVRAERAYVAMRERAGSHH